MGSSGSGLDLENTKGRRCPTVVSENIAFTSDLLVMAVRDSGSVRCQNEAYTKLDTKEWWCSI